MLFKSSCQVLYNTYSRYTTLSLLFRGFILSLLTFSILLSCKTIEVDRNSHNTTSHNLNLGVLGLETSSFTSSTFSVLALPYYQSQIRLATMPIQFDKKSYQAYSHAKVLQKREFNVSYIDSLPDKPMFMHFNVMEPFQIINALNAKYNHLELENLTHQKETQIITGISIALPKEIIAEVLASEEVYLMQNDQKVNALKLVANNETTKEIKFNQGVIFAYKAMTLCWHQNEKYQLEIVNLVEGNKSCFNGSNRSAKKVKKDIDYFKF